MTSTGDQKNYCMTSMTVDQILKVVELTARQHRQGRSIAKAYQEGIRTVSQEYDVALQTINDACRRRLNLKVVSEFRAMLKDAVDGRSNDLQDLIVSKAPSSKMGS